MSRLSFRHLLSVAAAGMLLGGLPTAARAGFVSPWSQPEPGDWSPAAWLPHRATCADTAEPPVLGTIWANKSRALRSQSAARSESGRLPVDLFDGGDRPGAPKPHSPGDMADVGFPVTTTSGGSERTTWPAFGLVAPAGACLLLEDSPLIASTARVRVSGGHSLIFRPPR